MRRILIAGAITALIGSSTALADACPTPEYPWTNDGSCVFDVFCIFGRSGDMDVRDGVKVQQCQLDRINDVSSTPPSETETDEPDDTGDSGGGPAAPGGGF